jgi:putative transposase
LRKEDERVKNSRFSEEQIIGILKQSEAGAKTSELCRQHGISAATFYGWRSKYGGLEVSEAKRLKQLEEENSKLKRIVADQALDITMLKDLVGKNGEPGGQESGGRARTAGAWGQRTPRLRAGRTGALHATVPGESEAGG